MYSIYWACILTVNISSVIGSMIIAFLQKYHSGLAFTMHRLGREYMFYFHARASMICEKMHISIAMREAPV